jgi:hypothetical protein
VFLSIISGAAMVDLMISAGNDRLLKCTLRWGGHDSREHASEPYT